MIIARQSSRAEDGSSLPAWSSKVQLRHPGHEKIELGPTPGRLRFPVASPYPSGPAQLSDKHLLAGNGIPKTAKSFAILRSFPEILGNFPNACAGADSTLGSGESDFWLGTEIAPGGRTWSLLARAIPPTLRDAGSRKRRLGRYPV